VAKRERKRMTAGERVELESINADRGPADRVTIADFRDNPVWCYHRLQARRIDAAIRKAAWEGYWVGRRAGQSGDSTDSRIEEMDLGRKYGHARRK